MDEERSGTLQIHTPEGICFSLTLAGPAARFLAVIIDLACVAAASAVLQIVIQVLVLVSIDIAIALQILLFFGLQAGYGILLEWGMRGQTLGKRLLRLRVVDASGLRLQANQVVLRNLLRAVDILPAFYLVGGLASLCSRRNQRFGDLAAGTIVIHLPRFQAPDLDQMGPRPHNSLRARPQLEARLRQRIRPPVAALALNALLRRDRIDAEARLRLFRSLAEHFRRQVEFPPELIEGLADEQLVRNIVESVYRRREQRAGMVPTHEPDAAAAGPGATPER